MGLLSNKPEMSRNIYIQDKKQCPKSLQLQKQTPTHRVKKQLQKSPSGIHCAKSTEVETKKTNKEQLLQSGPEPIELAID